MWLRNQPFFEFDYPFDDIVEGNLHMIVIKLPTIITDYYTNFTKSYYSRMYPKELVEKYFNNQSNTFKILTKHPEAVKGYVDYINSTFGTDFDYNWDGELDVPINKDEEVFNYHLINLTNEKNKSYE